MSKKDKTVPNLSIRYLALLAIGIPNLYIIYAISTPLTLYPSFWLLKLIYPATILSSNTSTILAQGVSLQLVKACVAGAAYYLLLILNLTTPMKPLIRVKSLLYLLGGFLLLNILRIVLFSVLFISGFQYFALTHSLTWYFGSTLLLVFLWFSSVFLFKIKSIPIYTDIKSILSQINK